MLAHQGGPLILLKTENSEADKGCGCERPETRSNPEIPVGEKLYLQDVADVAADGEREDEGHHVPGHADPIELAIKSHIHQCR